MTFSGNTFSEIYNSAIGRFDPERIAFCFNEKAVTFGELNNNVELTMKHLLKIGVKTGTSVGYTLPNCPEDFYVLFAIARIGAIAVPVFHMIPDMAKVSIFTNSRVNLVITSANQIDSLREAFSKTGTDIQLVSIDTSETADYSFPNVNVDDIEMADPAKIHPSFPLLASSSSGTTGIPKPVIISHSNAAATFKVCLEMAQPLDFCGKESYSSVIAFPLCTSGVLVVSGFLLAGVELIFSDNLSPVKYLELITTWKADSMSAPPSYFEALLGLPILNTFDLSSIKKVLTGMDFFSPSLLERLRCKFTNIMSAANGYGLMETSTIVMLWKALDAESLNEPTNKMILVQEAGNIIDVRDLNGNSVVAGEEGELYIKGASVINGYPGKDEETKKTFIDGWLKTGDFARKESETTVSLLGRNKYLIKRGGKTVSPIVVQNHINCHPSVLASAVVGVPHRLYGEMVWAFVVSKSPEKISLKDIMSHCRAELPNYMVPDQVSFIDQIPKTQGAGKFDFEKLKNIALGELSLLQGVQNG